MEITKKLVYLHRNAITVADFRSQQAKYLDLVLAGEKIFIRRKNKLFTIIPVDEGEVDITITPELEEIIEKARKEHLEGKTVSLTSNEDIDCCFDSM